MPTPTVRVRHQDVPMWYQAVYITKYHIRGGIARRERVHDGGHWICMCGKKRNTLRSIQRHVKENH